MASKRGGRPGSSVVPNAASKKAALLSWAQAKTRGYEHVEIKNFSKSWANGMAFCALAHKYFPEAIDYSALIPADKRKNLQIAFDVAEKHADAWPLLDVEDMMLMGDKPDPKCIFTYVTSLYSKYNKFEKPLKSNDNPATQAAIEKGLGSIGICVPKTS